MCIHDLYILSVSTLLFYYVHVHVHVLGKRDAYGSLAFKSCIHVHVHWDHGVKAMDGGSSSDPSQQSAQRCGLNNEVRVATFSLRGLTAPWKRHSLQRDLKRYRVDVCAVQETKIVKQFVHQGNLVSPHIRHC